MSEINVGPDVSAEAVSEIKETPGVVIGPGGRLLIRWEDSEK